MLNVATAERLQRFKNKKRTYYADHGTHNPVTYRYNFRATVADGTATADFTFFNEAGQKLTGKRCNVLSEVTATSEHDKFPTEMVDQIGKMHIFQIQFTKSSQQGSGRFVVDDILDMPTLPEEFKAEASTVADKNLIATDIVGDKQLTAHATETQQELEPLLDYTPGTPSEDVIETVASTILDTLKESRPEQALEGKTTRVKLSLAKELSAPPKKHQSN